MRRLIFFLFATLIFGQAATPCGLALTNPAAEIQDAFVKVAESVGPAVVSINTLHVRNLGMVQFYGPGNMRDPVMEEFFRQFFGLTPQKEIKLGLGSGVLFDVKDSTGYVLTNEHVVGGAQDIEVVLSDGRKFKGEVMASDMRSDLALIRIAGDKLPTGKLGDSSKVKIGQWAIAIGNPFGFIVKNPQPSVTVGVISAVHRYLSQLAGIQGRYYGDLIQTDASINVGNSGGPLLNLEGEIIGINTLIFSNTGGSQGIGFAIPINRAKAVLSHLLQGRPVPYGWLGIWVQTVDEQVAESIGLADQSGALIFKLLRNGPGHRGGLRPGDLVQTFNADKVLDAQDLTEKIGQSRAGETVRLGILRNGKQTQLDIVLGTVSSSEKKPSPATAIASKSKQTESHRGLEITDIPDAVVKKFNLSSNEGVMVTKVKRGSAAGRSGLRPGDIIDEVAHQAVRNAKEFKAVLERSPGKVLLHTDKGYMVLED